MASKKELKNSADVFLLVTTFYTKIRAHQELGPIFNTLITDWETHFKILTSFWESQLFLKRNYTGNPVKVHQEMDSAMENTITMKHFGLWLNLWFETIDALFEGETAWIAKNRAQKMSTMLFLKIYEHRNAT